jgi:hypothetical protein
LGLALALFIAVVLTRRICFSAKKAAKFGCQPHHGGIVCSVILGQILVKSAGFNESDPPVSGKSSRRAAGSGLQADSIDPSATSRFGKSAVGTHLAGFIRKLGVFGRYSRALLPVSAQAGVGCVLMFSPSASNPAGNRCSGERSRAATNRSLPRFVPCLQLHALNLLWEPARHAPGKPLIGPRVMGRVGTPCSRRPKVARACQRCCLRYGLRLRESHWNRN